jgi:protoporphyrinogen/coproporphyrinogen III oxidase
MQQLVETCPATQSEIIANQHAGAIRFSAKPTAGQSPAGLKSDHFDAVILAVPLTRSGPAALAITSPELSAELAAIGYSSSITVGLGYDRDVRQQTPPGFGFLVPRSEGKRLLAATFVHNKFPHRAPEDRALLRCFFAGSTPTTSGNFPTKKSSTW